MRSLIFALAFSLAACSVARLPSPTAAASPTVTPVNEQAQGLPSAASGASEAYFLLRTAAAPYQYQFATVPVECLVSGVHCSQWRHLIGLPGTPYSPGSNAPLHWAPDGRVALFVNPNTQELWAYEPVSQALRLLAASVAVVRDDFIWSPDGRLAAVSVQGKSAYSSYVALIDPWKATLRTLGADWQSLDGLADIANQTRMQSPLAWPDADELLVHAVRYQSIDARLPSKKAAADGGVYRLHIASGRATTVVQGAEYAQMPLLSPDGHLLGVVEPSRLSWRTLDAPNRLLFAMNAGYAIWSPDSAWMATILGGARSCEVQLTSRSGQPGRRFQPPSECYAVYWLPDSRHVLVVGWEMDQAGAERSPLYLLSVESGEVAPIEIAALNQKAFVVAGVSWRIVPPAP